MNRIGSFDSPIGYGHMYFSSREKQLTTEREFQGAQQQANSGCSESSFLVAKYYQQQGRDDQAIFYYLQVIEKEGNIEAYFQLGVLYGNKQEHTSSMQYHTIAMQAGCLKSAEALLALYESGCFGTNQDHKIREIHYNIQCIKNASGC